jgi:hypothetical protein
MKHRIAPAACAIAALAVSGIGLARNAVAQHAGDIVLTISPAGRLQTGGRSAGQPFEYRVFDVTLGELFPNFAEDPGFDCVPGTFGWPGAIGFRLHGPLLKWESGNYSIAPVVPSTGERIDVSFGPLGPILTPTTQTSVNGFTLTVGSNGTWHRHLEYTLTSPASGGVYLMEMTLASTITSTAPAGGESLPYWLVVSQGASETDRAVARQWVLDNKINPPPPPPPCPADFNDTGGVTVQDVFDFLSAWSNSLPSADFNGTGGVTVQDIFDFLSAWSAGCP